jgi:hypothetical protein
MFGEPLTDWTCDTLAPPMLSSWRWPTMWHVCATRACDDTLCTRNQWKAGKLSAQTWLYWVLVSAK